jgi:hypothetical protein
MRVGSVITGITLAPFFSDWTILFIKRNFWKYSSENLLALNQYFCEQLFLCINLCFQSILMFIRTNTFQYKCGTKLTNLEIP